MKARNLLLLAILASCADPVYVAQLEAEQMCKKTFFSFVEPDFIYPMIDYTDWTTAEPLAEDEISETAPIDMQAPTAPAPEPEPITSVEAKNENFRFVSTANFVITFEDITLDGKPEAAKLICTGDLTKRRITSVQFDGQLRKPDGKQDWAF